MIIEIRTRFVGWDWGRELGAGDGGGRWGREMGPGDLCLRRRSLSVKEIFVCEGDLCLRRRSFSVEEMFLCFCNFGKFGNFGKFETRSQLSSSGSVRLLVTAQSKILLLLAVT